MWQFLYNTNTPATAALRAAYLSGFGSEGTVNRQSSSSRLLYLQSTFLPRYVGVQRAANETEVQLWREPHTIRLRKPIATFDEVSIYSRIYIAYGSWDSSTTALVEGLTTPHHEPTEAFKAMSPGEHGKITLFMMLRAYFSTVLDCAKETGDLWRESDGQFVSRNLSFFVML